MCIGPKTHVYKKLNTDQRYSGMFIYHQRSYIAVKWCFWQLKGKICPKTYLHRWILVPFHHDMVIIWQVEQFFGQIHQKICQCCNFMAIFNLLRRSYVTEFLCFVLKLNNLCVAGLNTHFLLVVKWISRFKAIVASKWSYPEIFLSFIECQILV